jgi:hypothetical protein
MPLANRYATTTPIINTSPRTNTRRPPPPTDPLHSTQLHRHRVLGSLTNEHRYPQAPQTRSKKPQTQGPNRGFQAPQGRSVRVKVRVTSAEDSLDPEKTARLTSPVSWTPKVTSTSDTCHRGAGC